MTTQLADMTFLGWRADAWSAAGVWTTIAVYAFVGFVAYRQLKEARELRAEQTRPFVIVDVAFRSILIELSIKNIGPTAAKDVRITFDEPLRATSRDPDWQNSTAFTQGIPLMAPRRQMRFFLDSFPARNGSGLPMIIAGTVTYDGPLHHRRQRYEERFVIDLTVYEGSAVAEKGISDLVKEVEAIHKEIAKWTDGNSGIVVNATDRDRGVVRSERPFHLMKAREARNKDGWKGAVRYFLELWQRRRGW